jgi:hypothetical protein
MPKCVSKTVPVRVMPKKQEDPEARLKAFHRNRWERRRKLLPKLNLKYPDDNEQESIARLAGIKNTPRFTEEVRSIILDAHLGNQQFKTLSAPEVKELIRNIGKQAKQLKDMLAQLDVGCGSEGSYFEAGFLLEAELYASESQITQFPDYIVILAELITAAERAAGKKISYPRGSGGNPAFDMLIDQLLLMSRIHGTSWTNYRSAEGKWIGTLLDALSILKKYLPRSGFFPQGDLGRSIEHIRTKLNQHLALNRGQLGDL